VILSDCQLGRLLNGSNPQGKEVGTVDFNRTIGIDAMSEQLPAHGQHRRMAVRGDTAAPARIGADELGTEVGCRPLTRSGLLAGRGGAISGAVLLLIDTREACRRQRQAFQFVCHGASGPHAFALGSAAHSARIGLAHASENPRLRGWEVDEDAIANFRIGEAVWLIHPAAHCARITVYLGSERFKIEVFGEKIGV